MSAIEVRGVAKAYATATGERLALRGIELDVEHGEFVCLLGPSGCGKTTLLNILSGLDVADQGRVTIRAPDGGRPTLGYVFQQARLLPWLTVTQNLGFVRDGPRGETGEQVAYWLERVGLSGRGGDYPNQLSVGQQQRVAVARALLIRPHVLFMDEPFSSLDELTASRMREELLDLWDELRCTVVFVTHNPLEATFLADRIVVMSPGPGRIVHQHRLEGELPRPRDADDPRLWRLSREAVRALALGPVDAAVTPRR